MTFRHVCSTLLLLPHKTSLSYVVNQSNRFSNKLSSLQHRIDAGALYVIPPERQQRRNPSHIIRSCQWLMRLNLLLFSTIWIIFGFLSIIACKPEPCPLSGRPRERGSNNIESLGACVPWISPQRPNRPSGPD